MIQRPIGNTGVTVSALGMGCMRFENPQDIDGSAQTVLRAFERGINYIDTAPFYCEDLSETIVGVALKEIQKTGKPYFVSSKTSQATDADIRERIETSLERLGVDSLDFYHVWWLVRPGELLERKAQGCLDTFRQLKEEGLIRHIAVSTHLDHQDVGEMLDQGEGLFESMLIGLNAANFSLRIQGVQEAARRGMGVMTMNTLGGGLITDYADKFESIKTPADQSVLQAALRFNLSIPEVSVALVGFRNVEDVDSAADAMDGLTLLDRDALERHQQQIIESREDLCTQCNYCRDCPEGVPVIRFMEAYNHYLFEPDEKAKLLEHLTLHWGLPHVREALEACTQCGLCEARCTQHLPILQRFEDLKQVEAVIKG